MRWQRQASEGRSGRDFDPCGVTTRLPARGVPSPDEVREATVRTTRAGAEAGDMSGGRVGWPYRAHPPRAGHSAAGHSAPRQRVPVPSAR